jgi:hypothetical protein
MVGTSIRSSYLTERAAGTIDAEKDRGNHDPVVGHKRKSLIL